MEQIESVKFGFYTDEEVKKHSFMKITNPTLLDNLNMPIPGGLYDPAMGPLDEQSMCKSCGQRSFHCSGHCGHIELVVPAYNPLLFDMLHNIVQSTCFYCHHFRAGKDQVEKCISQLELIVKGDVIGGRILVDSGRTHDRSDQADSDESNLTWLDHDGSQSDVSENLKQHQWTCLQLTEAINVLNNFLKLKNKSCKRCKAKNQSTSKHIESKQPTITKPIFGWFYMELSNVDATANAIRGAVLEGPLTGESSDTSSGGTMKKTKDISTEYKKQKTQLSGNLLPSQVKDILKLLWENEVELCAFISNVQRDMSVANTSSHSMFFLDTILVPPTKFRPPSKGGDSVMEHPHTVLLCKVLESNISLGNAHVNNMERSKIIERWRDLQQAINVLYDSKKVPGQKDKGAGICQMLEKKEGIFRQKMMGKRVNSACRSVISPDPYLAVNEIGIPPCFATILTYPEKVTPWNSKPLREAIINGPMIHPGATRYVDNSSTLQLRQDKKSRISIARKLESSRGSVTQPWSSDFESKTVHRHVRDGDVVLVNRQPTLHKPGIMAHIVRVLKGEKTIRMHYANCSTYNADFDGDEMNVHLPQDEISRAEAYHIVNANNQYIVPTRGEPLRGLIQDHIVSAVLLTMKNAFLSREEYNQLIYSSGVSSLRSVSLPHKPGKKVYMISSEDELEYALPAILKPEPIYTGKQVITAILTHITRGCPPFTLEKEGKLSSSYFTSQSTEEHKTDKCKWKESKAPGEENMYIYKNYLVRGVIDKAQFGKYGLVHTVQELYGSNAAGDLLSVFSRLFTVFLQMHGFTCGVDDLLLLADSDSKRIAELKKCNKKAEIAHHKMIDVKDGGIEHKELQMKIEKVIRSKGESAVARLDGLMRSELTPLTNDANQNLFPHGLQKPFPDNCFSLMTTTGAKGSSVNFQQVSSLLGQQELEGKRVPRMVSGKTLPCFQPWDWTARSGGYIVDNFLKGLRPQEYYFHCMAGREGLVDTAVKTSRSGYLQRCIIKNMEGLKVCYDHTVRDIDGSIVQFTYGEDGIDVLQASFIDKFESLMQNHEFFHNERDHGQEKTNSYIVKLPLELKKKAQNFLKKHNGSKELKEKLGSDNYEENFMKLVQHKYLKSLTQPGEPVGVIAAQSVGEPSTQMTLNTFHLAGRGEMNVTLGIPRLQEILMTATDAIKTPIMTCPLREGGSVDSAKVLASKLKRVSLADVIKSIVVSFIEKGASCRIYKLKITLYEARLHPPGTNISLRNCREILTGLYVRVLEDAIENYVNLLSRISGIKNFKLDTPQKESSETAEGVSTVGHQGDEDDDNDSDENDADDLGLGLENSKKIRDEVEYDDDSSENGGDNELDNPEVAEKVNKNAMKVSDDDETGLSEAVDDTSEISLDDEIRQNEIADVTSDGVKLSKKSERRKTKPVSKKKKKFKKEYPRKDSDRSIFVSAKGLHFEAHFKFDDAPHVLLDQIAQIAAKKVYVTPGKIDHCSVCDCSEKTVIYHGNEPKARKPIEPVKLKKIPALQTAGLDFDLFWKLQDDLDIRYLYTNNIHAILKTYGVEAARESIVREIQTVFGSYGVSVDSRHLSLIADFMTFSGGYSPMSRHGGISESVSPFSKISFETAAKFIQEAAYHGLSDNLESPSARIVLGLPVKMGTGSFDLFQRYEV